MFWKLIYDIFKRVFAPQVQPQKRYGAIVPEEVMQPVELTVLNIPIGEVFYVGPWGVVVKDDRTCYLDPKSTIALKPSGGWSIRILRDDLGYHITIPPDVRLPRRVYIPPDLIPIVSIEFSPESLAP